MFVTSSISCLEATKARECMMDYPPSAGLVWAVMVGRRSMEARSSCGQRYNSTLHPLHSTLYTFLQSYTFHSHTTPSISCCITINIESVNWNTKLPTHLDISSALLDESGIENTKGGILLTQRVSAVMSTERWSVSEFRTSRVLFLARSRQGRRISWSYWGRL